MIPHKLNQFWLFQQLGAGAMGCVFKAFHNDHQRSIYAVKTLSDKEKGNQRLIRALQREAQISSRFSNHPNIINFVTHGWGGDQFYMALEYIQGETLLQRIKRCGKLSELESLQIIAPIVSAEKFVCDNGCLFRDLKPENILISKENVPYLFDFGLSLPTEVAELDQGMFLEASPIYVPPERLTGEGEDESSEIYSLGMVLYHAIVGQPYYTTAQDIQGILKRHVSSFRLSGDVTKMSKISKDVADVITKMIKRDPEDRYQTMDELAVDIDKLIQARRPKVALKPKPTPAGELKLKLKPKSEPIPSEKPKLKLTLKSKPDDSAKPKAGLKIVSAQEPAAPIKPKAGLKIVSTGNQG
jgi:eukaryotic-like serine/threonine-protein kinase